MALTLSDNCEYGTVKINVKHNSTLEWKLLYVSGSFELTRIVHAYAILACLPIASCRPKLAVIIRWLASCLYLQEIQVDSTSGITFSWDAVEIDCCD